MPLKVSDIVALMEETAHPRLALAWDNVGLLMGRADRTVTKVCMALDPSPAVVKEAVKAGAQMLITHHPLFLRPIKSLDFSSPLGNLIEIATKNDLAIYAAHTNLDRSRGGVNEILAEKLGISEIRAMEADPNDAFDFGLGFSGELPRPFDFGDLCRHVAKCLGIGWLRAAGNPGVPVSRVAVCAGGGRSMVGAFLASDAQVFITGDLGHHDARDIADHGRACIDAGHFATEHPGVEALSQRLYPALAANGVEILLHPTEKDPFHPVAITG